MVRRSLDNAKKKTPQTLTYQWLEMFLWQGHQGSNSGHSVLEKINIWLLSSTLPTISFIFCSFMVIMHYFGIVLMDIFSKKTEIG